jgi:hypothetical protein
LECEERLRAHFAKLRRDKSDLNTPVFAIEHPLEKAELAKLRSELTASLRALAEMSAKHRLCWVVHAGEHGYDFAGLEFWDSYAQKTANWSYFGSKDRLRTWYVEFAKTYTGVKPQGDWGKHYTFIAWPIMNALAPRDIQVHLARTLFNARYFLNETRGATAETIGRFIAPFAENPSSRFRFFLQQSDLVGYLVRGLLEGIGDETVIYRPALERITRDLNARANAREWLRDARRQYSKTTFHYGSQRQYTLVDDDDDDDDSEDPVAEIRRRGVLLKPRVVLTKRQDGSWLPVLRIPGFQPLIDIKREFQSHLMRSKFTVPAHGDQQFLGASLLTGTPLSRPLKFWPVDRECVLRFNRPDSYFDHIVGSECQLEPAKIWLFHDHGEGLATPVSGGQVRAGERYVVVARHPGAIATLGTEADIRCEGIHGVELEVPNPLDNDLSHRLEQAGLSVIRKLRLQPAGLRPRQWSEDGFGEWLSTETPTLAVHRDFDFDGLTVEFQGGEPQEIKCGPGSRPAFIQLKYLPVGRHSLFVKATKLTDHLGAYRQEVAQGELQVYVRPPTSWAPGKLALPALVVATEPAIPSLDDLFNCSLGLQVIGDTTRKLTVSLVRTDDGGNTTPTPIAKSLSLPLQAGAWDHNLQKFLNEIESELPYFTAASVALIFSAEDTGEQRIGLELPANPLRWAYSRKGDTQVVTLLNDGIEEVDVQLAFHPFARPHQPETLELKSVADGLVLNDKLHGLFYAHGAGIEASIVVGSAKTSGHGFEFLKANADHSQLSKLELKQLLVLRAMWCAGRAVNTLARYKRNDLCGALHRAILAKTCSEYWMRQEAGLTPHSTEAAWGSVETEVGHNTFGICVSREWRRSQASTKAELLDVFAQVANTFRLASYPQARAAWVLATEPGSPGEPVGSLPPSRELGTLMRGARLLLRSNELGRRRDL